MRLKKIIGLVVVFFLVLLGILAWQVVGPVVHSPEEKYFYIATGSGYNKVRNQLKEQGILSNTFFFNVLAQQINYTEQVKPGRYEIKKGSNVLSLVRMLKAGRQSPVKLVINKWRTKEDMAKKLGRDFEISEEKVLSYLNSNDSLARWDVDTTTVFTSIIPATYEIYWNTSFTKIFNKLKDKRDAFWTDERLAKAQAKNLSPKDIYIISSIVDEETNKAEDKGKVASVYINRVRKGMKLQADPTVKFALRDFTLTRILYGHLKYPSPYNTYYTAGLPPGPICTALPSTLDAVLDSPETNYIFFAARPDFKGYHAFAETYAEHKLNAAAYQKALDSLILTKQQKAANP